LTFRKVASLSDFDSSSVKRLEVEGLSIMIIRLGSEYHALDAVCTHEETDLSRGIITGEHITCPLHLSRFSIRTGEVDNPPAEEPLHKYELKIVGRDILVDI
jgi:naphthalene 1,2-dioxygenase system ferredoxin subunit